MVAINFSVFTDKVADGTKCQTIRANDRKGQIKPGVRLQLYTGMRSSIKGACRKLVAVDPVCVSVEPVRICDNLGVKIGDSTIYALETFAELDGFESWADMLAFFDDKYGLPFVGVLIRWEPCS